MQAVTTQQFLHGDCIEFLHGDSRPRLSAACRNIGNFNTESEFSAWRLAAAAETRNFCIEKSLYICTVKGTVTVKLAEYAVDPMLVRPVRI